MAIGGYDINAALDNAVAKVAHELLPCDESVDHGLAARICQKLEQLATLRSGGIPDYNDSVTPPLYSTWYQLAHVNMAVGAARRIVRRCHRTTLASGAINIVDIGSGTFALPIGFEVMRLLGELDTDVTIISVEQSREMEFCGRRILQALRGEVSRFGGGSRVSVQVSYQPAANSVAPDFFCLFHAAYPGVDKVLSGWVEEVRPVFGLSTIHANRKSRERLTRLQRKVLGDYESKEVELDCGLLKHGMPATRAYRQWLWHRINLVASDLAGKVRGLMKSREIPTQPASIVATEYQLQESAPGDELPW